MLVSGAGAASATKADARVWIRDVTPNPVVVKPGAETTAYVHVRATSDVSKVVLTVIPTGAEMRIMQAKEPKVLESWRFSVGFTENDPAGKWKATATAYNAKGEEVAKDDAFFAVEIEEGKAETRITRFSADPYKVRKGKSIYFSGLLQELEHGDWDGVRGEKVHIYYRANGSSGWKWVASDRTDRWGKFYAKTKAYRSGTFRAVFPGDSELEGTKSRTDYVRVYGSWWRR
ncbi:MAG TPA: hypothetical protein VFV66_31140 [Nonomuraea sp.]|nr:hypothetical protein [Nonomuraea sp.]